MSESAKNNFVERVVDDKTCIPDNDAACRGKAAGPKNHPNAYKVGFFSAGCPDCCITWEIDPVGH